MRKLALSDEMLMQVEKPARYIGNEINSVTKNITEDTIRFCICFPDILEIGMSHLGIQILYDMFNQMNDVYCERVYSPWPDLSKIMKERRIPLFALESQDPIKKFDFLGITIQYEMCYTNILQILDLSQIPLHAKDRTWDDPIVIGGGPCTYNPEPLAEFFDVFYIGEGETVYGELIETYKAARDAGISREDFLLQAANIPGLYVPMFYDAAYNEDGTLASFLPNHNVPATIDKQVEMAVSDTYYPVKPVIPFVKATQDRMVLEILRGCIRGCRFCQAGMIYRPFRERDLEVLKQYALELLENTGYDEISLSSLSSSDYSRLNELVTFLIDTFSKYHVNISLPSLRIDAFSLDVMSKVQDVRKSSLTFAPEAGSQRMRNVINKGLTEEDILNGASQAFAGGWNKVKLYFMLGLPGETTEDILEIAHLCQKVADVYFEIPKEQRNGKVQITASSSFFVPKPFTPFQWVPMNTKKEFLDKARVVNNEMKQQKIRKCLRYNWHEADVTVLEGIFARGDRRLAKVLEKAYNLGCIFDSWSEFFDNDKWLQAFQEADVDMDFYVFRERDYEELLPWDFINAGVSKKFMWKEYERSKEAVVTPNCRVSCAGCGAFVYDGGVCKEKRNGE